MPNLWGFGYPILSLDLGVVLHSSIFSRYIEDTSLESEGASNLLPLAVPRRQAQGDQRTCL